MIAKTTWWVPGRTLWVKKFFFLDWIVLVKLFSNFGRNVFEIWQKKFGRFVETAFHVPRILFWPNSFFWKQYSISIFRVLREHIFDFLLNFENVCRNFVFPVRNNFFDKNCVFLRKIVVPYFFDCVQNLFDVLQKISPGLSKVQHTCP